MEVTVGRSLLTFPFPPRSECVGELRQREDAFSAEALDLLFPDAAEQAEAILLHRLLAAALPELADLTVAVEHQPRRFASRLEPFHLVEHLFRLSVQLRVQPNLADPGLRAAGD